LQSQNSGKSGVNGGLYGEEECRTGKHNAPDSRRGYLQTAEAAFSNSIFRQKQAALKFAAPPEKSSRGGKRVIL
jgi:hypothetical protein